ncbi:hypothetical protein L9F63_010463, partial [Diploptera punctata]
TSKFVLPMSKISLEIGTHLRLRPANNTLNSLMVENTNRSSPIMITRLLHENNEN